MAETIRLAIADAVATITIDRPEKRNALGMAELRAISAALEEAATAPIRALVVTGAGDRVFSGGVDLSDVGGSVDWSDNPLSRLCDQLQSFPRPTIARVNGAVIGGAAELSFSCDFRVGAPPARLWVPAARIGIHYEASGLARAAAVVGWQAVRRIYLLGETLSAETLSQLGYFDRLAEAGAVDAAVAELLAAIKTSAPLAIDGMAQTIREMSRGETKAEAVAARIAATWASEDLKEGVAAIAAKRPPEFKGR